jgi:uroporphyrinogen-III synthase
MQRDHEPTKLVDMLEKTTVISIGPFTADELKKLSVKNVIADVHTISGSFDALVKAFSLAKAI